jgi:hypothetical protein
MATRYIDPDYTETVEIGGVSFVIGYWPPMQGERADLGITKLQRITGGEKIDFAKMEPDLAFKAIGINREMCEDAVRYSVRSWTWEGAPSAEMKDGALTEKCIRALHLSGLLYPLSARCFAINQLTEDEKKSSGSPSA